MKPRSPSPCWSSDMIPHDAVFEETERGGGVGALGEGEGDQGQTHAHEDHVAILDLAPRRDDHQLPSGETRHHEWRTKGLAAAAVYGWRRIASSLTSTPSPGPCGSST